MLRATDCHPTADDIYVQVREEMPHISLGTVYRNLRLLKKDGDIIEVSLADGLRRFDGKTQNHYHFKCEGCNRLFDIDEPVDKALDERVARNTGFKISYHRLEFCGLCIQCQNSHSPKGQAQNSEDGEG